MPGLLGAAAGYLGFRIANYVGVGGSVQGPAWLRLAVWIYCAALLSYTTLPITAPPMLTCLEAPKPQFVPGESLVHAYRLAMANSGLRRLVNPYTAQYVLNAALFLPLGAFLRLVRGMRVRRIALVAAGVSVSIEIIQGTEWFGLQTCMFRTAQVDDVLMNVAGAVFGALLVGRLVGRGKSGSLAQRLKDRLSGGTED